MKKEPTHVRFEEHTTLEVLGNDGKTFLLDCRIVGPKGFMWKDVDIVPKEVKDLGNGWTRTTYSKSFSISYRLKDE